MNKPDEFTIEHKRIINKINDFKTEAEFINFFLSIESIEYSNYMAKLKESNDKEKIFEFETVKNRIANELFNKK